MRPGLGQILLVLAVVILLFGAKKLPELARSLGRVRAEFRKGQKEGRSSEPAEKAKSNGDDGN